MGHGLWPYRQARKKSPKAGQEVRWELGNSKITKSLVAEKEGGPTCSWHTPSHSMKIREYARISVRQNDARQHQRVRSLNPRSRQGSIRWGPVCAIRSSNELATAVGTATLRRSRKDQFDRGRAGQFPGPDNTRNERAGYPKFKHQTFEEKPCNFF